VLSGSAQALNSKAIATMTIAKKTIRLTVIFSS
jgi:hypothetical protein